MINRKNYNDVQAHLAYRRDVHRDSQGTQETRWPALRLLLLWAVSDRATAAPSVGGRG